MNRFDLDGSWRRPGGGSTVIAGSPLRVFRLTAGGLRVVEALEAGTALPAGHEPLVDRLLDAGAIHPQVDAGTPPTFTSADVTLVIPSWGGRPERLSQVVAAAGPVARTIVVDDASPTPLHVTPSAGAPPAVVHRRERNGGPGAARQDGWLLATTPLVAFVDDDVELSPGWLDELVAHFDDPRVALVAPRVRSSNGTGALAEYDRHRSPLDLGAEPARIRAGTRVSYVPAAAVVCRVDAVRSIGGFDLTLRFGEDVDFVWRLDEHGWRCRYEPGVVVHHQPRQQLAAWLRQRASYGSSAAPLSARHPGALAPVRMSGWSLAVWALVATGHPVAGSALAGGTTAALVRKLAPLPGAGRESLRLAGLGHLYAGRQLASAVTRAWWPLALGAALVSRRARRAVVAAALVPAVLDRVNDTVDDGRQRLRPGFARHLGLRLLDDGAYGWGLWRGVVRHRTLDPLLPGLTSFPGRASTR